ncbi:RmlC-like cupin domain-containing protein [Podospora didyma]|uniref:RmlC-like cupin domain-containing protein n=1 Tax=Podospora didyma TaxID=330526 RepID=A0AAE0K4D0_9PEZI|nr:RmlC-like cupin domain-containing protein [Podospora didyma]
MPLTHKPAAQSGTLPLLFPNTPNAFLGDSVGTTSAAPIAAGFFRMEKGEPLVYEYTYDEAKLIVEGEVTITDETGESVVGRPGDVFLFPKGTTITFEAKDYALAFYVGQRPQL